MEKQHWDGAYHELRNAVDMEAIAILIGKYCISGTNSTHLLSRMPGHSQPKWLRGLTTAPKISCQKFAASFKRHTPQLCSLEPYLDQTSDQYIVVTEQNTESAKNCRISLSRLMWANVLHRINVEQNVSGLDSVSGL